MGLFSWLTGRDAAKRRFAEELKKTTYFPPPAPKPFRVHGGGDFDFEVVGESNYQRELLAIAGPKTEDGVRKYFDATLFPEDTNPHDKKAVAVKISGRTVGYLSRRDARYWREELAEKGRSGQSAVVRAVVTGGWKRMDDEGHFGVRLDLD